MITNLANRRNGTENQDPQVMCQIRTVTTQCAIKAVCNIQVLAIQIRYCRY